MKVSRATNVDIYKCTGDICKDSSTAATLDQFNNIIVSGDRKLICVDSTLKAPMCPTGRIGLQITTFSYYKWLGVCELVDASKIYED
jgi:hypothetical protein